MFIIGELINGMYKKVAAAIQARDAAFIKALARQQVEAGADALDVNCGPASRDAVTDLRWLVEVVQEEVKVPLSLDSTKVAAIESGLKACRNKAIINSTMADAEKLEQYFGMAKTYRASLIALLMDKEGVPQDKDRRLELAAAVLEAAGRHDFNPDALYLDPILMPINVAQNQLFGILELLRDLKMISTPSPRTVIGLSNISQGSTNRSLINRTFLVMASEMVLNKHIYCDSFVEAYLKSKKH
jgi:5-methyltetrahydrofolate corrinoid/iron sulfur protein methyltransferase